MRPKRRGQTIVELALVLPVLLMLLMMIVQYGLIMSASSSIRNLAREGARFAATQPADDDLIKARIQQLCPPTIQWADIQSGITISPAEGDAKRSSPPNMITVAITYNMRNKLFLPARFFGIRIFSETYTTQSKMMVEGA